jgi:DNA-binding response OmpR family regulator
MSKALAPLQGKAVLLVEDEPIIAMMLEMTLREAGASVIMVAPSVLLAKQYLVDTSFDLAILDRTVSDGLSYDAARLARDRGAALIFASGAAINDFPEDLTTVTQVTKPFDETVLLQAVGQALATA